jgi:spore coat protein U-like protein
MKKTLMLLVTLLPFAACAESVCSMQVPMELRLPSQQATGSIAVYSNVSIECPDGTPYQLEVQNAQGGGMIELVADGVSERIPVQLLQSSTHAPFGALNQGESIDAVGTGANAVHGIEARIQQERMPRPGLYKAKLFIGLNY